PAVSSSEPTASAFAASLFAPEESALLGTSVEDGGPALGFLLPQAVLLQAAANIRTISIFRIPYSTLPPRPRQRFTERTVPTQVPGLHPFRTSIAIPSGRQPRPLRGWRGCPPVRNKSV